MDVVLWAFTATGGLVWLMAIAGLIQKAYGRWLGKPYGATWWSRWWLTKVRGQQLRDDGDGIVSRLLPYNAEIRQRETSTVRQSDPHPVRSLLRRLAYYWFGLPRQ